MLSTDSEEIIVGWKAGELHSFGDRALCDDRYLCHHRALLPPCAEVYAEQLATGRVAWSGSSCLLRRHHPQGQFYTVP